MYLAMLTPAFIVSPGILQKVYGAKDDRAVRAGVGLNALALLIYAPVPAILGMIALANHPGLPARDLALPTLLMHDVPAWVGSLGLAALFSAEVSAADALLFMLATSLSQDLYRRFMNPAATEAQVLRVARLAAVAGGVAAIALAVVAKTVIDALTIFYTLARRQPVRADDGGVVRPPGRRRSRRSPSAGRGSGLVLVVQSRPAAGESGSDAGHDRADGRRRRVRDRAVDGAAKPATGSAGMTSPDLRATGKRGYRRNSLPLSSLAPLLRF